MDDHEDTRQTEAQDPDAGAFIGSEPELASETIPGGVQDRDEPIAGVATQSTGEGGRGAVQDEERGWPTGHREGPPADDDAVREAGQDR